MTERDDLMKNTENNIKNIEILNKKEVCIKDRFNWKAAIISFLSLAVLLFISWILMKNYFIPAVQEHFVMFCVCTILPLSLLGCCMTGYLLSVPVEYTNELQIAVLDKSAVKDLETEYNIIKQNGKLYTVREKKSWNTPENEK